MLLCMFYSGNCMVKLHNYIIHCIVVMWLFPPYNIDVLISFVISINWNLYIFKFTVAFIFNWVGFIVLLCFCHTVAGRTGALAGFGLSLAKWAVIVRHSTDLVGDSNSWLLWVIMVLGKYHQHLFWLNNLK